MVPTQDTQSLPQAAFAPSPASLGWDPINNMAPFFHMKKLAIEKLLTPAFIGPSTPCYVTKNPMFAGMEAPIETFEVAGRIAADYLAKQTHRLATPAEIEKVHADRKVRAAQCAAIEAANPNNKNAALNVTAELGMRLDRNFEKLGDLIDRQTQPSNPNSTEAPARSARKAPAGESEK